MPTNGMTIDGLNTVSALTAQDKVPVWDNESSGEPTKKITASNLAASVKSLASLPNTTEMNAAIAQSTAIKTMALSVTTNSNGTAAIPNTIIDPNTTIIIGIQTDGQGYNVTYTIINYNGALAYKIKMWDTSGATMQVDANRTSNITVYYRNY